MKIELDRQDIIKEIDENHSNDADFYFEIVDNTTTSWDPVRELVKKLIGSLKENGEIADLEDIIK